jgi:two-component system, LytTR family, response regulator
MKVNQPSSPAPEGNIIVSDGGAKIVIALNAVLRIESRRVYTVLYVKGRKEIVCSKNLGLITGSLPEYCFVQIHRSYFINLYEVRSYVQGRGGKVIMSDNTELEVAQRRKSEFLKRLNAFNSASQRVS